MFEGLVAIVTGAAGGLGQAISVMLASHGAAAVIGFNRNANTANEPVVGLPYRSVIVDVTDRTAMQAAINAVETEFGGIDVLVTAAGLLQPPPLSVDDISERQFDKIIDVNLKGTWNALSLVGPGMVRQGKGSIVTIASTTGLEPGPLVPYGPTKAAIIEMTKSYAGAWGRYGVRVNCVAPGFVETPPINRGVAFGLLDLPKLGASTALMRLPSADEIAKAVCFLASEQASGVTGAMLPVDCGALVMPGFVALERQNKR
jgi:NAD(P)-dependent dehydrogenase (short-subunit alcohol dehydrogenase family)